MSAPTLDKLKIWQRQILSRILEGRNKFCQSSASEPLLAILKKTRGKEGIKEKDYHFLGNLLFPNLYERLLHERKLKSGYFILERRIYERSLKSEPVIENQSERISKLHVSLS